MEDEKYRTAKARVEDIKGFYIHAMIFASINTLLFIINIISSPQTLWFYWVTIFWGLGLCWHAFSVFGAHHIFDREWEEKKIHEIMEKEKGK